MSTHTTSKISAPRGTYDLLPDKEGIWLWLHQTHAQVASSFGYRLIATPIFEATEMFQRGTGAGTDVVEKEMYTFTDRGNRSLTLRPEGTPSVVRAVLSAQLDQETKPVRVRYEGPMFRYDRPQAGRYRQFHQLSIECIGEKSPQLDVEVIEVAWSFIQTLGLSNVEVQINSLGNLKDRLSYRSALVDYFEPLKDQLCQDCQRRLATNPLRILDCKQDDKFVDGAPKLTDHLSVESATYFQEVLSGLSQAKIPYKINDFLVRGLDYYAHTTFELWHTSLQGAQNALCGGGRYDGLAAVLGFPDTPAVGYSIGVERVLLLVEQENLLAPKYMPTTIVVCSVAIEQAGLAAEMARKIRSVGKAVILDTSSRKLERKLRNAGRVNGSKWCVIIGEAEAHNGTAILRNLNDRTQESLPMDDLIRSLSSDH